MNKKILLLLVIACIVSAIAFKAFAGPAGHSGSCGIVCSASSASSTTGATNIINVTTGTVFTNTINTSATCVNGTNTSVCFTTNTSNWPQCNDTVSSYCDPNTIGYNLTTYTNKSYNINFVAVSTGSVEAAWFADALVGTADDRLMLRATSTDGTEGEVAALLPPQERVFTAASVQIASDPTDGATPEDSNLAVVAIGGRNPNQGNEPESCVAIVSKLLGAAGTPAMVDAICFPVPSVDATTDTYITPIIGRRAGGAGGPQGAGAFAMAMTTRGPAFTARAFIIYFQKTGGAIDPGSLTVTELGGGIITDIHMYDCKLLDSMTDVSANKDKMVCVGEGTQGGTESTIVSITDMDDGATTAKIIPAADGLTRTHAYKIAVGKDFAGQSRIFVAGTAGANLYPIVYSLNIIGNTVTANSVKDFNTGLATAAKTSIVGDGNLFVYQAPYTANVDYYVLNSEGNLYTQGNNKNTIVAALSGADKHGPALPGAGFMGSAVYSVPTTTGSKVIVTSGNTIVSVFDVNYTVDSGGKLSGTNNGGITGDNIAFVLGGRSLDNGSVVLEFLNTSLTKSAINPNGTMQFTTDKIVAIQTMSPDINILNFQLRWQNFTGTFDTTKGTCIGCTFDAMGTCQAEVEKIWGMFNTYNLTINLTPDRNITMQNLQMCCRDLNRTIALGPAGAGNCTGLTTYPASTYSSTGCFTPTTTAPYSYNTSDTVCVYLQNLNTSGIQVPLGTITPTQTCEMIACEINGTWNASNDQTFTINKTITVTAI